MEFNFDSELLKNLDANEIIILSIVKHFGQINKNKILEIYSKISSDKLDKIVRLLIKKNAIYYGKNYALNFQSVSKLEQKCFKNETEVFQICDTIKKIPPEKNKTLTIYKEIKNNTKNNTKNKNKEKENNIKNIIKEKENLILKKPNEIAIKKTGYKVYNLTELLKIIDKNIPREYIMNLFEHFESQNFKSSGTLITNLKTRIELYYKKNWYANHLPKINENETNKSNPTFEQRLQNIAKRNDELRAYGVVNEISSKN